VIRRRAFLAVMIGMVAAGRVADAQPGRPAKIGWLNSGSATSVAPVNALGWDERRDDVIEARYADGRAERLRTLANELVAPPVDVIVAAGTPATLAAAQATRSIPIVMVTVADPVGSGLVRNFARPEGNVTGQEQRALLIEHVTRVRIPAMFANRRDVLAGGLISYGPDFIDSYRRAATYVDKILKGTKPSELPVERSRKFELVINRKTATTLGLTIPPRVLLQADEVVD